MAETSLKDRLMGHAKSFDGLLSLIPAKFYYGEDNSDQWKKKKQTKEQAAAARRAKLDPDSAKSAKDVMDERARKRKLEQLEDFEESEIEGIEKELPKQGLKYPQSGKTKKQKISTFEDGGYSNNENVSTKDNPAAAGKHKLKQERKKEKKIDAKKQPKSIFQSDLSTSALANEDATVPEKNNIPSDEILHFQVEGLKENPSEDNTSVSHNTAPTSPTFEFLTDPSTNTSTSSVVPPAKAPRHIKLPTDPELLRSRLASRIEALRAARKADGPDGRPARNRQELLEARRKKEEQRRAHKKELRMEAKAQEDAKREVAVASARDSPSNLMSSAIQSPEHNLSFGRVFFADGQQLTDDLRQLRDIPKKRGPQDVATALLANEMKRKRIAGLEEEKRVGIEEKELWLKARKRAHGEKVRDDLSLLKKTLKRKEKAKKKSEKEWTERKDGVAKSQAMKQKKREENLKKRRDEKGSKSKLKDKGKSVKTKKPKVKSRPGFEGSFGSGKRK